MSNRNSEDDVTNDELPIHQAAPALVMMTNRANSLVVRKKLDKTLLPEDYEPSKYSVICGRGKGNYKSHGNVNFRAIVKSNLERYRDAPGRLEKSFIVSEVLNMIRESCPVGAFVKYEKGRWYDLDDAVSREKVGSLFRDFLHTEYKSSAKAKHARKLAEKQSTSPETVPKAAATVPIEDDDPLASAQAKFYDIDDGTLVAKF